MRVYPLKSISIEEAMKKQFKLIDCMTRNFKGYMSLSRGDLGVKQPNNEPDFTIQAEKAIADFFDQEACILVRGAGTGAIRYGLASIIKPGELLLIHDAPVYSTTTTSLEMFGINTIKADFNNPESVKEVLKNNDIKAILIQHTRQKLEDSYDLCELISLMKSIRDLPIIIDENYAVMKVDKIGCEAGADLSCFSCFKLQGPEGIGCVVGKKEYIYKIRKMHYSGGCQVQGFEAQEVLRGLAYAPVILAVSAQECEIANEEVKKLDFVKDSMIVNAQSKVMVVELKEPLARKMLVEAEKLGALPHPVGSESKYEVVPLFYKVSGTFLKEDPKRIDTMIRINVNRAGHETVIRILSEAYKKAKENE